MSTPAPSTTLRGYVAPCTIGNPCRVALFSEDIEYPILPKGAGVDLADMVSIQVEVKGNLHEDGENQILHVRSYTVLEEEEDEWLDE